MELTANARTYKPSIGDIEPNRGHAGLVNTECCIVIQSPGP